MAPCTMMRPGITRPSRPGTCAAGVGRLSSAAKSEAFNNEIGAEHVRLRDCRALRLRGNTGVLFGLPCFCSWEGINRIGLVRHFVSSLAFSASREARRPWDISHIEQLSDKPKNECYSALIECCLSALRRSNSKKKKRMPRAGVQFPELTSASVRASMAAPIAAGLLDSPTS